jgi:branched-chain amino acid transport system substrate-binding protein
VPAPGCQSHAECFDILGQAAVCRAFDKTCVPLFTEHCLEANMADGALKSIKDDAGTIVLGALVPFTSESQTKGRAIFNSTSVAVREIANAKNGIPSQTAGGRSRPLVFVPCDQIGNETAAVAHLVDTLRVPAIIGPQSSGVLKRIQGTTITAHTLLISPSATASDIATLKDNNLVWRTAPPDTLQAKAIASVIATKLEGEVRTAVKAAPTDKLKLAVLHKSDSYGTGLETDLRASVTLNGEPLSSTNPSYKPYDYGDPSVDPEGLAAGLPAKAAAVAAQAPHIVIIAGSVEAATKVLPEVEKAWTEPSYRPRYVLTDGVQTAELVQQATAGKPELAARIIGTAPGTQSPQFFDFRTRYTSRFPDPSVTPDVFGTAGAYDATYMLVYSIFAAGEQPLTGELIATGFGRLVDGEAMQLGSEDSKNKAFDVLAGGANININGASGPLDFNVATGDAPSDIQVWCVSSTNTIANTGAFLDAAGTIQGTFKCP